MPYEFQNFFFHHTLLVVCYLLNNCFAIFLEVKIAISIIIHQSKECKRFVLVHKSFSIP